MEFSPIEGGFGVVVTGARLARPDLAETAKEIERALDEHLLLLFRDSGLDQEAYVRFGSSLGELEPFKEVASETNGPSLAISNADAGDHIFPADHPMRLNIAADALWHTDHTYRPYRARYSILMAETVPERGGETEFCNTRAAYDALPEDIKERIDGQVGLHSIIYSRALAGFTGWSEEQRAALPPIPQPLVFENPRTGRRSIYLASHIAEIVGWPTDKARKLVSDLVEFATQPQFVFAHKWRPGDIAIWDDRATMHRRAPYDDLNELRRLFTMRVIEKSELYDPQVQYEFN